MTSKAFICAVHGKTLTDDERKFLADAKPWGVIIFDYNAKTKDQLKSLVAEIKTILGKNAMILVDQEGGRIQRLKPPTWNQHPSARSYLPTSGPITNQTLLDIMKGAADIAKELKEVGINVDCFPDMDVPVAGANNVIGDRAYSLDPVQVCTMARAAALGLIQGGALPVIKHIPGHGRATVNSHLSLPTVNESLDILKDTDFLPFQFNADFPMAMVAHIVYSAIDPTAPASQSTIIIDQVIRKQIGFNGILMTDDLTMEALTGSYGDRAKKAIAAGIDIVLMCNDTLQDAVAVANAVPDVTPRVSWLTDQALAKL